MINTIQWRVSIGLWYCHQIPHTMKKGTTTDISGWVESIWSGRSGDEGGGNLTFSLVLFLLLLLILSGDIELNPGPETELTSNAAFLLLCECGFQVFSHWETLAQFLHMSIDERRRLRESGRISENYNLILEEALDWWITHSSHPSWEELARAVKNCGERDTAYKMREKLELEGDEEEIPPTSSLHPHVQQYRDIMIGQYKDQPVVPIDWPPPVGQDFFGRLALLQTQDRDATPQTILQKQWCMLRGQVDKIPQVTQDKQIDIQDVLKPCDSGQSLRVVVDGPPGIGKTTLCRKLLNMWAKGELTHGQYNLVLYCPLRNDKIAQAKELRDILKHTYDCDEVTMVTKWLRKIHGGGLLIIFDGWDELSRDLRQSSLAARIIRREILAECSVIVTSRSYASYSLLELPSVNRHVEVLGFSEKEIKIVIKGTLEKEPHLAEKLIQDLEVRGDVQSLCYIPLVCSIVILVYRKSNGQLPTTLTELYENFILQTVRRHVKIKHTHNIEPRQLHSLHHLPSVLDTSVQEICQFAYHSLKETRWIFSSLQLNQSLSQSVKEDYLGLLTIFTVYDEESYQFLHLSIQEFLAAWWIAKYEKTEEVFAKHFDNDHFRMCLRFVAGLTHLDHQNYQQYFSRGLDVQCIMTPLLGFEPSFPSHFNQKHVSLFGILYGKIDVLLLHLLYESQNTKLCQIFSQAMKNHSLCFHGVTSSPFDILCLNYLLVNSTTTWNYLDLGALNRQLLELIANTLNQLMCNNQCIGLEMHIFGTSSTHYDPMTLKIARELFPSSLSHNLQECYIVLHSIRPQDLPDTTFILLHLIKLQHLKLLQFDTYINKSDNPEEDYREVDKMTISELEVYLCNNTTLHELIVRIDYYPESASSLIVDVDSIVYSVVKGVTRNKSIQTFSLTRHDIRSYQWRNLTKHESIGSLLKDNHMIQAFKLDITDNLVDIVEVNMPLTALEIGGLSHQPASIFLQSIKGLRCLVLRDVPISLPLLFQYHPNLEQLTLSLNKAVRVNELFTILQSNTTLKALRVSLLVFGDILGGVGPSLQKMLTLNKTLEYLAIEPVMYDYPSSYFSSLTAGLSCNTSLRGLNVPIRLTDTNCDQITRFFDVISQKNNLSQFKGVYNCNNEKKRQLFYEQVLPFITKMLESHTTMSHIECFIVEISSSQPKASWLESTQHFWHTVFLHPSLEYVKVDQSSALGDTVKLQLKMLIDMHRQQHPSKPLPIITTV